MPTLSKGLGVKKFDEIVNKMLPISIEKNIGNQNTFRSIVRTFMNNLIDLNILSDNLDEAQRYLDFLNLYLETYHNMQFKALAMYYESIIGYKKNKEKKHIKNIKKIIHFHKYLNHDDTADGMQRELNTLLGIKNDKNRRTEISVFTEF